jgi:hypothetical protein
MKKTLFYSSLFSFALIACNTPSSVEEKEIPLIENGAKVTIIDGEEDLQKNHFKAMPDSIIKRNKGIESFWGKAEPHKNEELPKFLTKRKFIDLAALGYEINHIPGYILRYSPATKEYEIATQGRFIKGDKYPDLKFIEPERGLRYSSKIDNGASFNGSAVIGSISCDAKQMMELIITDNSYSIVPDSLMLKNTLKNFMKKIPENERQNYYFVKSAMVTTITHRKSSSTKFDAKVNYSYITAGGNVYGTNEKFSNTQVYSVDLISLKDTVLLFNPQEGVVLR